MQIGHSAKKKVSVMGTNFIGHAGCVKPHKDLIWQPKFTYALHYSSQKCANQLTISMTNGMTSKVTRMSLAAKVPSRK